MLPKMPIKITFDPTNQVWWNHLDTRILVLLWKPCHLTSQDFWRDVARSGELIAERKPTTIEDLANCLQGYDFQYGQARQDSDAMRFAGESLPYFLGQKQVTYEISSAT